MWLFILAALAAAALILVMTRNTDIGDGSRW